MGVLADFFIAQESGVPDYDGAAGFPAADRVEAKRITPLEAAAMLSVLTGGGDPVALIGEFELLTPQEAETWTMSVPTEMVDALAKLDPASVASRAEAFATSTAEELGWSAEESAPLFEALATLARRAQQTDRTMYLWNSM